MSFKPLLAAALLAASPAVSGEIDITDSYARSASPVAKTGAAFLVIERRGGGPACVRRLARGQAGAAA
ncbi:hypothetical protein ACM25N_06550 [Roseovarius sp. C7]|uniref:hypothetical protein n=1 Tax=Roseovarius sp. C7 TaxID=3398643 RepID=UPI0039F6C0FB